MKKIIFVKEVKMFFGKKKKKEVKRKDIDAMAKRIEVMSKDMDILTTGFLNTTETNIQKVRR